MLGLFWLAEHGFPPARQSQREGAAERRVFVDAAKHVVRAKGKGRRRLRLLTAAEIAVEWGKKSGRAISARSVQRDAGSRAEVVRKARNAARKAFERRWWAACEAGEVQAPVLSSFCE